MTKALDPTQINKAPHGATIKDYFADKEAPEAQTSGTLSATKMTVYWGNVTGGVSRAILWHEGLHAYGAYLNKGPLGFFDDLPLMNVLSLKTNDPDKSYEIDRHIQKYCF